MRLCFIRAKLLECVDGPVLVMTRGWERRSSKGCTATTPAGRRQEEIGCGSVMTTEHLLKDPFYALLQSRHIGGRRRRKTAIGKSNKKRETIAKHYIHYMRSIVNFLIFSTTSFVSWRR